MSGDTISTAILTIATVVCATSFVAAIYPPIFESSAPIISTADNLGDRMNTNIKIIHEAYDSGENETYIWVKNIGNQKIVGDIIVDSDVFLGEEGNVLRLEYNENGEARTWSYVIENGGDSSWDKGETIRITAQLSLVSDLEYFVKFISYNGISSSDYFTV